MTRAIIPLVGLALSACGAQPAATPPPAQNTVAADGTDYRQAVTALPDKQKNVVFIRAIRDARQPCQRVISNEAVPDAAFSWVARCEGDRLYMVAIQTDGTANVTGPLAPR